MTDLFVAELRRHWILLRRYPMDAATALAALLIAFAGVLAAAVYMGGTQGAAAQRLQVIAACYGSWVLARGQLAGPGTQLFEDARAGVLEQVFVGSRSFAALVSVRALARLILQLPVVGLLLLTAAAVLPSGLLLRAIELVPMVGLALAAAGLGLAVAACALVRGSVQGLLSVGQLLLLGLIVAPVRHGPAAQVMLALLPLTPAVHLLQSLLSGRASPASGEYAWVLVNGAFYFVIGYALLAFAAGYARSRGVVSGY